MAISYVLINYWAVLVAAIIHMVLGALWYSPSYGFGNIWMKLSGLNRKKMNAMKKKGMTKAYILAFVSALVLNYILANFIGYVSAATFVDGMFLGFLIWFGFLVTTMLGMMLWEGKSYKLYLINVGYYLVSLLITGGILAVWS